MNGCSKFLRKLFVAFLLTVLLAIGFFGIIAIKSTPGDCYADLAFYLEDDYDYNYSNAETYVKSSMECLCKDPEFYAQNLTELSDNWYTEEETQLVRQELDKGLAKIASKEWTGCPNEIWLKYGPVISSLLIVGINMVILLVIRISSKIEGHSTQASLSASAFWKIFIFTYINTAIIPLLTIYLLNNSFFQKLPIVNQVLSSY